MPWTAPELQALGALRLNRSFPDWRSLGRHLRAIRQAGTQEPRCPSTGWPLPEAWAQVAVDQRLAGELLQRLAFLEQAGDPVALRRASYLRELSSVQLLGPSSLELHAIQPSAGRFELRIDRLEPSVPRFVRWSLRGLIPQREGRVEVAFEAALLPLLEQPAATVWAELASEGLQLEELIRGEIGPLRPEPQGSWFSAVLSRASARSSTLAVDDPLVRELPVPEAGAGFGFSRQRKWAVPVADRDKARRWLDGVGSRNIVYTYGEAR